MYRQNMKYYYYLLRGPWLEEFYENIEAQFLYIEIGQLKWMKKGASESVWIYVTTISFNKP